MNTHNSTEFHEKEAFGMTYAELYDAIKANPQRRAFQDYRTAINALDRGDSATAKRAVNRLKEIINWLHQQ